MEKEMSDYIKYEVRVYTNGDKFWYKNGQLHREDGPALEYASGGKYWCLNGKSYAEADFNKEIAKKSKNPCEGKIVEIDGKKYTLTSLTE